jgi:hypothetical protein
MRIDHDTRRRNCNEVFVRSLFWMKHHDVLWAVEGVFDLWKSISSPIAQSGFISQRGRT